MLELINIDRAYKSKKGVPIQALKDINLSLEDKGMVFVLGKSGSGKSTLLNLIGGLDFADSGEIVIDGRSTKDFKQADYDSYRNTYIGFVFQEYNILDEFTVGENISLALELQGQKRDKQKLEDILKEVDLEGCADRNPNELSGGQKQRVAIARAIIKDPKIIMADEPTGALDSETGKSIFDTLKRLSKDRLVIVVSHDREFAETYGDRVIELADGEVISDEKKNTQEEVIESTPQKAQIQLKKSRLPYKRALSLGVKTLRNKKLRIAVTIILCFFSFTAFGLADAIVAFNVKTTASLSLYENNDDFISFNTYIGNGYNQNIRGKVQDTVGIECSISDLQKIRQLTGLNFQGIIDANIRIEFLNEDLLSTENGNEFYKYYGVDNVIPASQQLFDTMGFKLYGRLPKNLNEIIITKHRFDQISLAGIKTCTEDILPKKVGDIDSFLRRNVKIQCANKIYKIVGIVDTFADVDKTLFNCQPNDNYVLNWTLYKYFNYGYHSLIYVDQMLYDNYIEKHSREDFTGFGRGLGINLSGIVSCNGVADQNSLKYLDRIIWLDGNGDRNSLAESEILIGIDSAVNLWAAPSSIESELAERSIMCGYSESILNNLITFEYMSLYDFRNYGKSLIAYCKAAEKLSTEKLEIYKKYCKDNNYVFNNSELSSHVKVGATFRNLNENFDYSVDINSLTEKQWRFSYACYLSCERAEWSFDEILGGYNENITGDPCGENISVLYADTIFVENRIQNALNSMKQIPAQNYYISYSGARENSNTTPEFDDCPKIVGIYIPNEGFPKDFVINDKVYDNSFPYEDTIFEYLIAPLSGELKNKNIVRLITDLHYDTSELRSFYCNNPVYFESDFTLGTFYSLRDISFVLSAILGIFSMLLLGNYIEQSISSKKKDIGLLRAIGAKNSDIVAIFINEGIIITLIILLLACIGVGFAIWRFNLLVPEMVGLTMNLKLLNFGFRQFAILMTFGFGSTAIVSAIPLYRLSKKKPVDSIQSR